MHPIKPQERIVEIDILRGIAVLGMILWNFKSRSLGNYYASGIANDAVCRTIAVLNIENTVHLLFSFLFGWGLATQIRPQVTDLPFARICVRRLTALFVIGIANCFFLYRPDFLHLYAMLAGVLFLYVNRSDRVVLTSAVLLVAAPALGKLVFSQLMSPESYYDAGSYDSLKEQTIIFSTYSDLVLVRIREFLREYSHPYAYVRDMDILSMFLFGLYAARRGVFQNVLGSLGFIRKVLLVSLTAYLLGLGGLFALQHVQIVQTKAPDWLCMAFRFFGVGDEHETVEMLVKQYSSQALALFYICLLVMVLRRDIWKRFFLPLASLGRLALSNYLLNCLIGTTLFYGYGLALYGKLGCASGEMLAILVVGFQVLISSWWLRKFRLGPAEWLWMSVTYWKRQPFRVQAA